MKEKKERKNGRKEEKRKEGRKKEPTKFIFMETSKASLWTGVRTRASRIGVTTPVSTS